MKKKDKEIGAIKKVKNHKGMLMNNDLLVLAKKADEHKIDVICTHIYWARTSVYIQGATYFCGNSNLAA